MLLSVGDFEKVVPERDFGCVAIVGEAEGEREGGRGPLMSKTSRTVGIREGGREGRKSGAYHSMRSHMRSMAQDSA